MTMVAFQPQTAALDFPANTPYDLTLQFCVEDCLECMRTCERCAYNCLRGLPLTWMVVYRKTLLQTADLASRTARAVAHDDRAALDMCGLCADTCQTMARECEAFDDDDFRACAEACRRCAESCRDMMLVA
jgi:hypothetical protein